MLFHVSLCRPGYESFNEIYTMSGVRPVFIVLVMEASIFEDSFNRFFLDLGAEYVTFTFFLSKTQENRK